MKLFIALLVISVSVLEGSCSECRVGERRALLSFKAGIIEDSSQRLLSWKGFNCCVWRGVTCNKQTGRVVGLRLPGLLSGDDFIFDTQMKGSISEAVGDLEYLEILDLNDLKELTGFVPRSIGKLVRLRKLFLNTNKLGGSIPQSVGNLRELRELQLQENNLSGSIPESIAGLQKLHVLHLYSNRLTGSIPVSVISRLGMLRSLDLHSNFLAGSIPRAIGKLKLLQLFDVSENALTGSIPYSVGELSNLSIMYMNGNRLSGSIPPSIGKLSNLGFLRLQENQFTGPLPSSFGNLINLQRVSIAGNRISGPIPDSIGRLSSVTELYLNDNQLSGAIPKSVAKLSKLLFLYLSHNKLSGNLPEEIAELSTDGHPVVFLHGGPGAGTDGSNRRFFDPNFFRIVLFDQRGAGKSRPHACLEDNTTWELIKDIEKLRKHLDVDKWQVFGGSWGSTLALAYAQSYAEHVTAMVLRGIFLLRKKEIDWFYEGGASAIYPDAWEKFRNFIPEEERDNFVIAYAKRLNGDDPQEKKSAAKIWTTWEMMTSHLLPNEEYMRKGDNDDFSLAFACIENHYFKNKAFFPTDSFLLDNVEKIRHIPTIIVQGRYDICCPMISAWDLHKAWPEAEFKVISDAGHSAKEPGITAELVAANERIKELVYGNKLPS